MVSSDADVGNGPGEAMSVPCGSTGGCPALWRCEQAGKCLHPPEIARSSETMIHLRQMNKQHRVGFTRRWGMPSGDTFDVPPIGEFVKRWLSMSALSVDPFARNNAWATYRNDINPSTAATYHMDAEAFLHFLAEDDGNDCLAGKIDVAILDPPYSPRQISELYKELGLPVGRQGTQNGVLYARVKAALLPLLTPDATVLSFGWNSAGMGKDFRLEEVLLVAHGGAHNDTICLAERRL